MSLVISAGAPSFIKEVTSWLGVLGVALDLSSEYRILASEALKDAPNNTFSAEDCVRIIPVTIYDCFR